MELDLRNRDFDDLGRVKFAGPGWAKVELASARLDPDTGATVLQFTVLAHSAGDFAGCTVEERLRDPATITVIEKATRALERAVFWARRLGALGPEASGRVRPNFARCVGGAYVLRIETRPVRGQPGKTFTGPAWFGIYPCDHPDIPADVRAVLGLSTED